MAATAQTISGDMPTADAEFDEFVYLLSHDVRACVRAMRELPGWIQEDLLENGINLPENVTEYFCILDKQTKRLDRMLLDLLTYSRIGRLQNVSEIIVAAALEEAMLHVTGLDRFQVTSDLKLAIIRMGDRDLVTLFSTLISNAVKHHPDAAGKIHIEVGMTAEHTYINVEDDGNGIPEKDHARVLNPMVLLKARDEVEGSGMGLSIARKIASKNNGNLTISSGNRNVGAKISVQLQNNLQD